MKKFLLLFFIVITSIQITANARDVSTNFDDYKVTVEPIRKNAKVKILDTKSKQYATMLREGSKKQPNFSNNYILTSWGCGASCVMTAAINAKNGSVIWLPFTVCCWDFDVKEPLQFKRDSNLLIVKGSRNEEGNGIYYYFFENQKFTLLKSEEKNVK